jgi:condensin complex subunit 1
MLALVAPLIVHLCTKQHRYPNATLQAAASLALTKFMLVSADFCEANLQLLFTIAEKSPSEVIRANLVVALGDLTKRFPNLVEPWTPNLYARLRDTSGKVRVNAVNTLSHLILNDMVKVKGQISEMAACIVDAEERIQCLVKLFFTELAKKGNALYNIMPDIISRLSDAELPEAQFQRIMEFLFPNIQKDKQTESMVEKLCHRFRATQ